MATLENLADSPTCEVGEATTNCTPPRDVVRLYFRTVSIICPEAISSAGVVTGFTEVGLHSETCSDKGHWLSETMGARFSTTLRGMMSLTSVSSECKVGAKCYLAALPSRSPEVAFYSRFAQV